MDDLNTERWQISDSRTQIIPRVATLSFRNDTGSQDFINGTKRVQNLTKIDLGYEISSSRLYTLHMLEMK